MGLDVNLCHFENVDTDAILKLSQFVYQPSAAWLKWASVSEAERRTHGPWPSESEKAEAKMELIVKARELGLPECIIDEHHLGGKEVSFPSKKHPDSRILVGEWTGTYTYYFDDGDIQLAGRDMYYVFPEAVGDPHYLKPDWAAARIRLLEIVAEIRGIDLQKSESIDYAKQELERFTERVEVIIETIDYVLSQEHPREFLLYWSA